MIVLGLVLALLEGAHHRKHACADYDVLMKRRLAQGVAMISWGASG